MTFFVVMGIESGAFCMLGKFSGQCLVFLNGFWALNQGLHLQHVWVWLGSRLMAGPHPKVKIWLVLCLICILER